MPAPVHAPRAPRQRGGITILVTMLLLVLLTIASLALSKSSIRQAITSGTIRQAAQAQNLADAGIEWAVYWVAPDFSSTRATPTSGALSLQGIRDSLQLAGSYGTPAATLSTSDMTLSSASGLTQSFDVTVTLMGQVFPGGTSMNVTRLNATATTATALNLWGVRTNGLLAYSGGPTFVHRREAWFTAAPSTIAVP